MARQVPPCGKIVPATGCTSVRHHRMADEREAPCSHCGSDRIVRGVRLGQEAEAGSVGLSYQSVLILTGTEPLVADLCDECGTVARLYVRKVGKRWWTA